MSRFNPSVVLLVWLLTLLLLISRPWPESAMVCAVTSVLAFFSAPQEFLRLLRRSRWLLLAVLLMFGWMTPGMPVIWLPGATGDGLLQAADQVSRLVISIAMVAALLSRVDTLSLLTGCHGLLKPLRFAGLNVERLVLRLALTLRKLDDAEAAMDQLAVIHLPVRGVAAPDFLLMGVAVLVLGVFWG